MLFNRKKNRNPQPKPAVKRPVRRPLLETLEGRTLLSAAVSTTMHSDLVFAADSTSSSSIQGYTPSQIRTAYGFNDVNLSSGSVAPDGQGQTIAIVDAYNDPDIASDLGVFDSQFGLASASLKVVNETGGSTLPATDAGWAGEISLDVEWAHAIAPAADILLVEANSDSTDDLMAAVNYARNAAGVSVVSMSWGGSEFEDWGNGGESDSQLTYDSYFTTPAGHQGVTFVAAAGDSGEQDGVQWPASSPNVLSVGGTTLTTSDDSGTYESESGWSGTSSGYSQVETEPAYQDAVQDTGARSVSDVSYDADPNTGFAVYDSVADDGVSGWQEVGGTSAGAPQWSALVAIADQGRTAEGKTTLDGASQTLDTLYGLYGAPGTAAYSTYTTYFNDVTSSGGGGFHFRWGGYGGPGGGGGNASEGYDTTTGLGSPQAASIVDALVAVGSSSTGTTSSSGGSSGGTTTPSELPVSPLTGTITGRLPTSIIGGVAATLNLELTNTSDATFTGPVSITLYASTDGTISSTATDITTITVTKASLKVGKSTTVKVKFDYPTDLTGSYYLIASATATGTDTAATNAVTSAAIAIAPPAVDLSVGFAGGTSVKVKPGKKGTATITITNLGNVTASGTLDLSLYASDTGALDTSDSLLNAMTGRKIKIAAGKSVSIKVSFTALDQAAGTYDLVAIISSNTNPADDNSADDTASVGTASVGTVAA